MTSRFALLGASPRIGTPSKETVMNKHLLHKSGRGSLIAALSVVSSLALAQSAGTAADTTGADGASARIQRGPAPEAGTAATPGEQMTPATQGAPLNAETQGFVGGSESPSAPATPTPSASTTTDSGTIPAAPPPAPAAAEQPEQPANPATQGFVGGSESTSVPTAPAPADSTANDSGTIPAAPPPAPAGTEQPAAGPDPQGFVGGGASPTGPGVGPGNAAPAGTSLDSSQGIWETQPGNSVTTPGASDSTNMQSN